MKRSFTDMKASSSASKVNYRGSSSSSLYIKNNNLFDENVMLCGLNINTNDGCVYVDTSTMSNSNVLYDLLYKSNTIANIKERELLEEVQIISNKIKEKLRESEIITKQGIYIPEIEDVHSAPFIEFTKKLVKLREEMENLSKMQQFAMKTYYYGLKTNINSN